MLGCWWPPICILYLPQHSFCTEWYGRSNRKISTYIMHYIKLYVMIMNPFQSWHAWLIFQKLEGQNAGRSSAGSWEASSQKAVSYLRNTHLPAVRFAGWSAQRHREALLPLVASLRVLRLQVLVLLGASTGDQWFQEGCYSGPTLLSPQPSWQWRSPQTNLGTEKMQERDPVVSFSSFTSFSTFLTPLLHSQLCVMPPPLLLFWEQCESTYFS